MKKKKTRQMPGPEHYEKWVARNSDETRIVGYGETMEEAEKMALEAGEENFIFDWIPPKGALRIGGEWWIPITKAEFLKLQRKEREAREPRRNASVRKTTG